MQSRVLKRVVDSVSRSVVRPDEDFVVVLGERLKESMISAVVSRRELWEEEATLKRLGCLLSRHWEPDRAAVTAIAKRAFLDELFGHEEDLGPELFDLMVMHSNQDWDFSALTEHDLRRASALEAFTIAVRRRLSGAETHPRLNLGLATRNPLIERLVYPMVIKIPVVSFRWFLEVHVRFAFNEIRKSGHKYGEELIAFLYEVLFLQQKTAVALAEYLRLAAYTGTQKGDAALINAEVDAIMGADLVFSYLKASIEKTMALIGLTHGVPNLDSKKDHSARLRALKTNVPELVQNQGYYEFIMEFVKSENLEELNSYRSGLLHKRGIADLQPHNYVGVEPRSLPFLKIYSVLHEQHSRNTAVLLATLALLTDELVRHVPPDQHQLAALSEFMEGRLHLFTSAPPYPSS